MKTSLRVVAALVSGILFSLGLSISGMIDPSRVLGFLDVAGDWDPSLAFVLAGAVPVSAIGYALSRRLRGPLLTERFDVPTGRTVDARLLLGSALFGVGWGLSGLCPGPALAALPYGGIGILAFAGAMAAAMVLYGIATSASRARPASGATP